jgi:small-conductance mechanosensitive channel
MKSKIVTLLFFLLFSPLIIVAAGGVTPATMEKYRQTKDEVEKLPQTKANRYAKDMIEAAKKSVVRAQEGLKAGDEKMTKEAVEMAQVQIALTEVLSEERESAEKTAATKAELEKLEQKLASILAGKGDGK